MTTKSGFVIYSLGHVAKDKPPGVWDIEVVPTELIVDMEGDISKITKKTINIKDPFGKTETIETETGYTIVATWLQFGSTRSSPPDVCAGETVLIFHFEGTDNYYWVPLYFEPDLRKRETALFFYSNKDKPTPGDNEGLLEKGYYFKVDTNNKLISLHTADNDGENAKYDFELNTKDGEFNIKDSKNNSFVLDSSKGTYNVAIKDKLTLQFKTISITNGNDELISLLIDLVSSIINEQHIGNLGSPTKLSPTSISKYKKIMEKLKKFKG